jgi:hypothetical protein
LVKKSKTCRNAKREFKSEYNNREEAQRSADYVMKKFGGFTEPVKCDQCNKWHIGIDSCECASCAGRHSGLKTLYSSYDAAEFFAYKYEMQVYECPVYFGYHLASPRW